LRRKIQRQENPEDRTNPRNYSRNWGEGRSNSEKGENPKSSHSKIHKWERLGVKQSFDWGDHFPLVAEAKGPGKESKNSTGGGGKS